MSAHTEQQAATKWCAHVIASHTDPRSKDGDTYHHNCIGSQCMAWRWASDMVPPTTYGFCGLAGKP